MNKSALCLIALATSSLSSSLSAAKPRSGVFEYSESKDAMSDKARASIMAFTPSSAIIAKCNQGSDPYSLTVRVKAGEILAVGSTYRQDRRDFTYRLRGEQPVKSRHLYWDDFVDMDMIAGYEFLSRLAQGDGHAVFRFERLDGSTFDAQMGFSNATPAINKMLNFCGLKPIP